MGRYNVLILLQFLFAELNDRLLVRNAPNERSWIELIQPLAPVDYREAADLNRVAIVIIRGVDGRHDSIAELHESMK